MKWSILLTAAQSVANPSTLPRRLYFEHPLAGSVASCGMARVEVGLQEIMGVAALEKRIRALEQAFSATGKQCICRTGGQTAYHSAEELVNIMDVRCPAHGFRDLGHLRWLPSGLPLQPDDQNLCSCPPCPVREFLQGLRGPLTDVEQEKEEQRWERECGPGSDKEFRRKQARVEKLLQKYEYKKRNRRRTNG